MKLIYIDGAWIDPEAVERISPHPNNNQKIL
jgi:hypothetical protein